MGKYLAALSLVLIFLLAACSSVGGAVAFDYNGQWTGTFQDNSGKGGTVTIGLIQNGSVLDGIWQWTYSASGTSTGGDLNGVVTDVGVDLELIGPLGSACPILVDATRTGNALAATYDAPYCNMWPEGNFIVGK